MGMSNFQTNHDKPIFLRLNFQASKAKTMLYDANAYDVFIQHQKKLQKSAPTNINTIRTPSIPCSSKPRRREGQVVHSGACTHDLAWVASLVAWNYAKKWKKQIEKEWKRLWFDMLRGIRSGLSWAVGLWSNMVWSCLIMFDQPNAAWLPSAGLHSPLQRHQYPSPTARNEIMVSKSLALDEGFWWTSKKI